MPMQNDFLIMLKVLFKSEAVMEIKSSRSDRLSTSQFHDAVQVRAHRF